MINAFIGKLEGDGSVAFIYCHDNGDMSRLGKELVENYDNENKVSELLDQGHCLFPGKNVVADWKLANNKQYSAGGEPGVCFNKVEFLDKAVEEVQVAYLFSKGKWQYVNALSTTPGFVAARTNYNLNTQKPKKFHKSIRSSF